MVKEMREYTKRRIITREKEMQNEQENRRKYKESVLDVRLGLKKKLTENEKIYVMCKEHVKKKKQKGSES